MRMVNPRRSLVAAVAVWLSWLGLAQAQGAEGPFPVRHGLNAPQPFEAVQAFPAGRADGAVLAFANPTRPPAYSPTELRAMGYDFIRLPVNPAVLLANPGAVREHALDQVEAGLRPFLSQNIRVIFDLHFWSPPDKVWTAAAVIDPANPAAFERFKALVAEVAGRLARYPQGTVALGLLNEPPHCVDARWFQQQTQLVRAARAVAPTLPLLLTGCNGGVDNLTAMTARNTDFSDPNLLFTFHYYEPLLFTHQGSGVRPFVVGVPYPARAGRLEDAKAQTSAAVDGQQRAPADAAAAKAAANGALANYFSRDIDHSFIEGRLDAIIAWARANGVSPSRLIMGEYGAINWRKTDTPERLKQRLAWDADVRAAADARGVASAYWTLPSVRGPIFR